MKNPETLHEQDVNVGACGWTARAHTLLPQTPHLLIEVVQSSGQMSGVKSTGGVELIGNLLSQDLHLSNLRTSDRMQR